MPAPSPYPDSFLPEELTALHIPNVSRPLHQSLITSITSPRPPQPTYLHQVYASLKSSRALEVSTQLHVLVAAARGKKRGAEHYDLAVAVVRKLASKR